MTSLLLVLLLLQQDLIEQLKSDSPDVREEASAKLEAIGVKAKEPLTKCSRSQVRIGCEHCPWFVVLGPWSRLGAFQPSSPTKDEGPRTKDSGGFPNSDTNL
jgi:hypothetical protein